MVSLSKINVVTTLGFVAWIIGTAGPARAQESEQPAVRSAGAVEEVIVTARRREESERDIPTSIDAFTGTRLAELGYTTVEDVLKLSPGVTFEAGFSPSSTSIILRGITNDSRGVGPRTVGRFYGNVPLTNPSIMGVEPDLDTFDMRSVEVLKGPQGTLFGGSALAGAIRYEPNAPEFGRFAGAAYASGTVMASSDDTTGSYALMLNAPLGDSLAVRFAGSERNFPGFIDDTRSGEKDINDFRARQARLLASWKATESFSVDAQYLVYKGDLGGFNWVEGREPVRVRTQRSLDDGEWAKVNLLGARLNWDFGAATAVLEGNRLEKDRYQLNDVTIFTGLFGTGVTVGQNFFESTDQDTYEFRVVSASPTPGSGFFGNWQYATGLFYMKSDQTRPVILTLNFPTQVLKQGGGAIVTAEERAVYFDLTKRFDAPFELNLGGRYFEQTTEGGTFRDFSFSSTSPGGLPAVIPFDPRTEAFVSLKTDGFNPKAALRWFANDNVTVIASYAEGFRFGGINGDKIQLEDAIFNTDVPIPFTFQSDEIRNYELGVRTTWDDQRFTADLTAFYIDWNNLQVLQRAGVFAFTDNVGGAEVRGAEFELAAALSDNWSVVLNGSYQQAETTVDFESGEFGFVPSGTPLPQSPKWTGAAQIRHQNVIGPAEFDGSLTYYMRGSSRNNLKNTIPLDSYGTLDLALAFEWPQAAWHPRVSLLGKNLTDERAAIFGFTLGTAADVVSTNQPRQVALRVDLSF